MKKALKITGIVIGSLLLLLIVVPFAFKGKIKQIAIDEGNKMLVDARFDFGKLNISLFRHFPSATVTLRDFYIVGTNKFEGDTLVYAGRLSATMNIKSLFGDSGYDISRIALEDTYLKAIVLEDSTANWDIMKPSVPDTTTQAEEPSAFKINLKKLTLKNINAIYDDRAGKMYAQMGNFNATASGNLASDQTTLKLEAETDNVTFKMGAVPYLNKAKIYLKAAVDADLKNNKFTLEENVIRLNAIEAGIDGWLALLENDAMDMDLKLNTPKVSFKEILSLIPAIYAKDFESIQTTGNVTLDAWAKGTMAGDTLPAFNVDVKISDATFRYPDLPKGVDAINISINAKNPGGAADKTTVDIDPMTFSMAGNPFALNAHIATPVSDLAFNAKAKGTINLGMVKEIYPLDSMELNGVVNADMAVAGRMSYIDNEQYDKISASGTIALSDMIYKSAGLPDVNIKKSTFTFSPQYLNLSETALVIGRNDITLDSRLENYLAYALKDQTLKGTLNVKSNYLNIGDFMSGAAETTAEESTPLSVIEVPKNIDFDMNASLAKVIYDNLTLDNVAGRITVKDGRLDMRNLSMNTLGGKVVATAYYSTAQNAQQPDFGGAFNLGGVSFQEAFKTFVMIQKMAPIFEGLQGNFSGTLDIATRLDETMSPVLESVSGKGNLSTKDLSLSNVEVIDKIAGLLQKPDLKNLRAKDMNLAFTIDQGKIRTQPFDIKLGETNINLSGTTGLDQSIDYSGKIKLPASLGAVASMSTVDLKIGGTFTSPKVSLDTKSMATQAATAAATAAVNELGKKLGVDLSDAEAQKKALVDAAQKAGETIMAEAQKQADDLVAKAGSNPLAQAAAKAAADKVLKEARKKVDQKVAEATAQGNAIIDKAKQEQEQSQ